MAQNANYAGLGSRAIALILDGIVLAVLSALVAVPIVMMASSGGAGRAVSNVVSPLIGLLSILYFIVLEGRSGRTLGKKLVNIRVVKKDGSQMDMVASVIRNLLRVADAMFLYLVGIIVIIATDDNQRIGDLVAGTVVVKE